MYSVLRRAGALFGSCGLAASLLESQVRIRNAMVSGKLRRFKPGEEFGLRSTAVISTPSFRPPRY